MARRSRGAVNFLCGSGSLRRGLRLAQPHSAKARVAAAAATNASFKTPNLRNVIVTGPYFHDGSMETRWM
jgi:cytochrome c peroxidase